MEIRGTCSGHAEFGKDGRFKRDDEGWRVFVIAQRVESRSLLPEGVAMKCYFLALGTVVVVCVGCAMDGSQHTGKGEYHAPPAAMMQRPGPMVDGPGPGVMAGMVPGGPGGMMPGPGGMPCGPGGPGGPGGMRPYPPQTTQVRFVGPDGMHIGWQIPGGYAENQLVTPARYNFFQGATYRLKVANVPGREGLVLYPTLMVFAGHPNTEAYLAHNSVPLQMTEEDLDQIESNNFVTKVIYLPDAKYQELAIANVETLVSTRLDPGVDPVQEADKRGTIMAVLRIGNMDMEMPGQPGGKSIVGRAADGLEQTGHYSVDGDNGQLLPPLPIGPAGSGSGAPGIPNAMMVAGAGLPGQPISGMNMQAWGMPITGTPIGLPGPTHLPYGGPAGLKSHTVRNRTSMNLPKPVDHMLIDVKHEPGLSLPEPVKYIEYTEKHPIYSPGELSNPAWNDGQR
ncbi:MAG: hypothetical protein NTW75_07255 [Planctomycetales bacterium]|nr:hypothetical protein [Planctomycetales bacterium]